MGRTLPIEELSSIRVDGSEAGLRNSFCAREKLELLTEPKDIPSRPAKIQKVIFLLRDHKEFDKYFEPRVATLGPIHHGKSKYELGEKYKLRLAQEYVKNCDKVEGISPQQVESTLPQRINKLYQKIMENIEKLRERFEEVVTEKYNDEDLAWMLLVDGCAILQYIFYAVEGRFPELNIKNDSVTFARQDLFLLENQVPYCLLKLLMSLSEKKDELKKSIKVFIQNETLQAGGTPQKQRETCPSAEPTHLLDLLRTRHLGPQQKHDKKTGRAEGDEDWQSFRNLQELKAAGIHVRLGPSNYFRDISFTRRCCFLPGNLRLPRIKVDDSTGPKFMNMIAYEMCMDFNNDFGISSYISFLDSLIDEANDVKQLRKARVLLNSLGSDQKVANLFNEIGTGLVPDVKAYYEVKCQIQDYYDNKWMTWIAQFRHNHFSSPWSVLAFLGALLALGLSAIQTWYEIK